MFNKIFAHFENMKNTSFSAFFRFLKCSETITLKMLPIVYERKLSVDKKQELIKKIRAIYH